MADSPHEYRLTAFKSAVKGSQDLRRKRVEQSVTLRRANRDIQLEKRRALGSVTDDEPLSPPHPSENQASSELSPPIDDIVTALNSSERGQQISGTRLIRKALSLDVNPPIDLFIRSGCVPRLIHLLHSDDCPELQFEASWALTNIVSGSTEQTTFVIQAGAIGPLVRLISSPVPNVCEQAIWTLGNIAGEGGWARDLVLNGGCLQPLLDAINILHLFTGSLARTAVWTLGNLCRNKDSFINFEAVRPALPTLAMLLEKGDMDVLADTCWALYYMTDGTNDRITAIQEANVLPWLAPLLVHPMPLVQTPALRTIGNMVTGTDVQTDAVLNAGALPMLWSLLQSSQAALVKESTWTICNVLAGNTAQIQCVIDADIIPLIVKILSHYDSKCQREAAWAVSNMIIEASHEQLSFLLTCGALKPFLTLLSGPDNKTTIITLDGLTNLLRRADELGELTALCVTIEEDGNLDKLEGLQHHQNEEIYKKTLYILDSFFSEDSSSEVAPEENSGEFVFGTGERHIGGF